MVPVLQRGSFSIIEWLVTFHKSSPSVFYSLPKLLPQLAFVGSIMKGRAAVLQGTPSQHPITSLIPHPHHARDLPSCRPGNLTYLIPCP